MCVQIKRCTAVRANHTYTHAKEIYISQRTYFTYKKKKEKKITREISVSDIRVGIDSKCRPYSSAVLYNRFLNKFFLHMCVKILNVFLDLYLLLFLSVSFDC